MGLAFKENGQIDKAIICFQTALKIDSSDAWTYINLCVAFQSKGQFDEAKNYFQKSLEQNRYLKTTENQYENLIQDKGQIDNIIKSIKKNEQKSILIIVPVFNRKKITDLSLSQLKKFKTSYCYLSVYNDHSTEYDNSFLETYADEVIQLPEKMGIGKLRLYQLRKFLETDFDLLYLTDNDMIHDPSYIAVLEELYEIGNKNLPVCLYNSHFHADSGTLEHLIQSIRTPFFI